MGNPKDLDPKNLRPRTRSMRKNGGKNQPLTGDCKNGRLSAIGETAGFCFFVENGAINVAFFSLTGWSLFVR